MFPNVHSLANPDPLAQFFPPETTRVFKGNGTETLEVPGLEQVMAVAVGKTLIPLVDNIKVPIDPQQSQIIEVATPLVQLVTLEDGKCALLRSYRSNGGKWQAGDEIRVAGVWSEEPESEPEYPSHLS
jgi:hypothetical protein